MNKIQLINFILFIYINYVNCFIKCCNNNINLKNKAKIDKGLERTLYAKYLIDSRKSQKVISNITKSGSLTLNRYLDITLNELNNSLNNLKNNNINITNINNTDTKINNIIIDNNLYIDVKNVKNIKIITNNKELKIELDKKNNNDLNKNLYNEIEYIMQNIRDIDAMLNIINLLMIFNK